jgi:hypothetical protein
MSAFGGKADMESSTAPSANPDTATGVSLASPSVSSVIA